MCRPQHGTRQSVQDGSRRQVRLLSRRELVCIGTKNPCIEWRPGHSQGRGSPERGLRRLCRAASCRGRGGSGCHWSSTRLGSRRAVCRGGCLCDCANARDGGAPRAIAERGVTTADVLVRAAPLPRGGAGALAAAVVAPGAHGCRLCMHGLLLLSPVGPRLRVGKISWFSSVQPLRPHTHCRA